MRPLFLKYWDYVLSSYWFVPAVMALGAIVLSFAMTTVDARVDAVKLLDRVEWLYANQADGARTLLSTIAGSMITVAGVTFSITIAAIAFASGQFGPRILTNFMQDRGNQITLGTFIATFLYCLLVLRTVRSAAETSVGGTAPADIFVPHLSILCGLVLALASLGVLIYFINHVPATIHISNVIARIGKELNAEIASLIPEESEGHNKVAGEARDSARIPPGFHEAARPVAATWNGYVHNVDLEGLLKKAEAHDLIAELVARPGIFVTEGQTLVRAWPSEHVDEEVAHGLAGTFASGRKRTSVQDLLFLVDELVEIAARALSPGVNDPFTAMSCIDWLSSAIGAYARRELPGPYRFDKKQRLRVIAHPISFETVAAKYFDQLRPYVSADRNASIHMLNSISVLLGLVENRTYRDILMEKASTLRRACEENLRQTDDREDVDACYQELHGHRA